MERFVGIDVGAETIKLAELWRTPDGLPRVGRCHIVEHHKQPNERLLELLADWDLAGARAAAATGRFSRLVRLARVPTKVAQSTGFRLIYGDAPATVVSIGGHGFSVLELRAPGVEVFRENSRCSQGTGNFLRQLVARFDLAIEEASAICADVDDAAPLSGRCPVILKTDMTHLANKGESKARVLAGLYDAVCENVQVLIKPALSPARLLIVGGVSRAQRIQENFARFAARSEMQIIERAAPGALFAGSETPAADAPLYLEALGCAAAAAERATRGEAAAPPALADLLAPREEAQLERVPALASSLPRVRRMPARPLADIPEGGADLVLGFDIGSTGSKAVAVALDEDGASCGVVWEGYVNTGGSPVQAAQQLMRDFVEGRAATSRVRALAATGSGREIVGSLLSTCYGVEQVFVLNEIAAHAEGALHYDARVDTIFEIGGQDAKYIRLAGGRVVDAAMNEACSAGTGSFIEEQGSKFSGIESVVQLGQEALAADCGVSLGQHCSVFMAEIIDEAVAAGVASRTIIAGIYDSIIQNYLNRVKGSRSVGDVIFCQGMPFSADALASAVVRQTGSEVVVPPNPGTVGALGIALLALKQIDARALEPIEPQRFLDARVQSKDTFVCKATRGCGDPGNRCRIDRIATEVEAKRQRFTWGGGCSLWDKGTGKRKLPDRSPDPFREREQLMAAFRLGDDEDAEGAHRRAEPSRGTIGITDEFQLKQLFPFFATFLRQLGFDLVVAPAADQRALKRGIEGANVPFCAPMQQFHGLMSMLAEERIDKLFIPMLRHVGAVGQEPHSVLCPIVQGSPDLVRWDLPEHVRERVVSPRIELGVGNLASQELVDSCERVARSLGVLDERRWRAAHAAAKVAQARFFARCQDIGARALSFCREQDVTAVVVLGRPYTIYNTVLNSNVPTLLREQGAVAVPVDCFPIEQAPVFEDIYWGFGQRNLRAAHAVRRSDGVYSIWCSNYSCGPDSFNLHFYSYIMEGKPFAVIETDGHSGDAGTKTRVEAFLHCVREHRSRGATETRASEDRLNDLAEIGRDKAQLPALRARRDRVLFPRMGHTVEALVACLRGTGVDAECLPMPDRETVQIGRRYTSGKECVPMCLTLGSLLQRLERERDTDTTFAFFMPNACGPCRFGVYNVLHKIVLERLGFKDRVRVWSPNDANYFAGLQPGFAALVVAGFVAADALQAALYDVRPVERVPGAASALYDRYSSELFAHLERRAAGDLSLARTLITAATGELFGCASILERAGRDFAAIKRSEPRPTVAVVGEIYVRCDPFANDFVIDRLEQRGISVRFAPFSEWLEYTDLVSRSERRKTGFGAALGARVQLRLQERAYALMARALDWPARTTVKHALDAAAPYIRPDLLGEAVLTLGGPLHEFHSGHIDGVVSVGPLECMPNKLSEAQYFHVAERDGLASLTLPLNGDPLDPETLDGFAYEVKERFRKRRAQQQQHAVRRHRRLTDRARAALQALVAGSTLRP
ncbi:MAG: CoA activase [Myxococcales bacterium]|nr:CoA activase [Myxococcales bacterium]